MSRNNEAQPTDVDAWVEAYESAFAANAELDLTAFLPPPDHPLYKQARRELLRVDLELRWQTNKRRRLADYVRLFPDLLPDRDAIQDVAFEEYRLRVLAGENPTPAEYEQTYGVETSKWPKGPRKPSENGLPTSPVQQWSAELESKWDFNSASTRGDSWRSSRHGDAAQALLRENVHHSDSEADFLLAQAMTGLPEVGAPFLAFQLIAELGRGGFGRVYFARQGDLANRLVALKITIDLLGEEQKLAQLQHTNVVPIYSVHQAGPLQAVCMPYFGATTLDDVLRQIKSQAVLPTSGKSLAQTVRARKVGLPDQIQEDASLTLKMLEECTYVEAVLWLVERLADGLIHAHERGILHRDLKPANILLTDDGQPMLLDFNLSADTKRPSSFEELRVGGTLPYMAPEHLEALQGRQRPVDARSDVYSLGVILYEMLTGRLPFETRRGPLAEVVPPMVADRSQAPPRLRNWNPAVTPAVESLVRHCLQAEPANRYQTVQQLREDVHRHRQHRPLRFAPEPSWRERAQKWVRRHPRLASPATLGAITALVLGLAIAPSAWRTWEQWHEDRRVTQEENSGLRRQQKLDTERRERYRTFQANLASSRDLMDIVNLVQLQPEFMKVWSCEENRLEAATAKCRASLDEYHVLEDPRWQEQSAVRDLPPIERDKLRGDVVELLYVLAQAEQAKLARSIDRSRSLDALRALLASGAGTFDVWGVWEATLKVRVLALNERARQCFAADAIPRPFLLQQAELTRLRGDRAEAEHLIAAAEKQELRPGSADAYWIAGRLVADGEYEEALAILVETTEHSPEHHGAWLLRGLCHQNIEEEDTDDALICFDNCVVLRPKEPWGRYNRGLAHLHLEAYSLAEADFDKVIKLLDRPPALASAYVQRAVARQGQKKWAKAEHDLTQAIAFEPNIPELYYARARIRDQLGVSKRADAERDRHHVLANTPSKPEGWTYRGLIRFAEDPEGALADFETALAYEPDDILTLFRKARLLALRLKRPGEAVRVLDRALKLDSRYLDARILRGLVLADLEERERAHQDAALILDQDSTPQTRYQVARIFALTSIVEPKDRQLALDQLAFCLRNGYGMTTFQDDPYLRPLRQLPGFRRLQLGVEYLGAGAADPGPKR